MTNILIDSDKKLHNLLSKIEDCKEIADPKIKPLASIERIASEFLIT